MVTETDKLINYFTKRFGGAILLGFVIQTTVAAQHNYEKDPTTWVSETIFKTLNTGIFGMVIATIAAIASLHALNNLIRQGKLK